MSVFAPMDPRGPDMRRKQLVAKLAQQAGAASGAVSRIPMPARLGAMAGEGRAFRGAGDARMGGKANVTQSPNILSSVLARLGVLGHSHAEEVSQGHGLPIAPPAYGQNSPLPEQGSAIPTPNGPGAGTAGSTAAPTGTPGSVSLQFGSGRPTPAGVVTGPGALPEGPSNVYTTVDSSGSPTGPALVDPGFYTGSAGPIPLGNGLYYDPATHTVLGQQDGAGAGAAARSLSRGRAIAA